MDVIEISKDFKGLAFDGHTYTLDNGISNENVFKTVKINLDKPLVVKRLYSRGEVRSNTSLTVKGDCCLGNNLYIAGDFCVEGTLRTKDIVLRVEGNLSVKGNIDYYRGRYFKGYPSRIYAKGSITCGGDVYVDAITSDTGSIRVSGDIHYEEDSHGIYLNS